MGDEKRNRRKHIFLWEEESFGEQLREAIRLVERILIFAEEAHVLPNKLRIQIIKTISAKNQ